MRLGRTLSSTVALAMVLGWTATALAQAEPQPGDAQAPAEPSPETGEAAVAAQAEESTGLADLAVTAQRRLEPVHEVPLAVSAFPAVTLEDRNITEVLGVARYVPNLIGQYAPGFGSSNVYFLRGLGNTEPLATFDPAVPTFIDDIYLSRQNANNFHFFDVERVEVLRGPQGTLFGRNATSGAISLVSAPPEGEFSVRATGSIGNDDAYRGKAVINLPAFGAFAVKLAYLHDEIGGDYRNLVGGKTINLALRDPSFGTQRYANKLGGRNIDAGQVAIRGDFADLIADYRFDYTDARTVGRAIQSFGVIPDASGQLLGPIVALQPAFGGITNISPTRLREVANATSPEHVVTEGHSLTLTLAATDNFTVKSISAYRRFRQDPYIYDLAASGGLRFTFGQLGGLLAPGLTPVQRQRIRFNPANRPTENDYFFSLLTSRSTKQRQLSQEVQFQLDGEQYELTAGVFYFHERSPATDILGILSPIPNATLVPSPLDAAFGSGNTRTLSVNDSMAAYGQLTYHLSDSLEVTGGLRGTIDDRELEIFEISGGQGGQLGVGKYGVSFSKLNYTGIVTWRPTEDSTIYGKISSGYVAGGLLSGIPYKPESLVAYELGAKTQLFNNRVRLNGAAFYSYYKDLQTQNFINGRQFFDNAGKADIKGFELETEVVAAPGLVLSGNVGYADLTYKTFILNNVDVADFARTPYNSKWTGRVAAQYDAPEFANGAHLQGRVEGRYRSGYFLTSTPFRNILTGQVALEEFNRRPGYWLLDGRVGLVDLPLGGTRASVSLYGQNLLDKQYVAFGAPVLSLVGTYERGRTYGVELNVAF